MTSRENKDTALQLDKRISKSKSVNLQFTDPNSFVVLDDSKNIKYYGKITDKKLGDECTCPSWTYGMRFEDATIQNNNKGESRYVAENGINFQCKHIIAARAVRYGEKE